MITGNNSNMKKLSVIFVLLVIVGAVVAFGITSFAPSTNSEILRIHIRANSNEHIDQSVKYQVKDAVISAMLPILTDCKSKTEAEQKMQENFFIIENAANKVLMANGFSYTAKARLAREEFPARAYGSAVYDAGFYDALILELGEAKGDNWWCVVYPPLCFLQTNNASEVKYTSKLAELVKEILGD